MKRTLAVALAVLALALTAHAKKPPKVYDHTGKAYWYVFHSDAEAHVTVDGHTYDSYCDIDGTSVTCRDYGAAFVVELDDGRHGLDFPVMRELVRKNNFKPMTFHYRLEPHAKIDSMGGIKMDDCYCVGIILANGKQVDSCELILESSKPKP